MQASNGRSRGYTSMTGSRIKRPPLMSRYQKRLSNRYLKPTPADHSEFIGSRCPAREHPKYFENHYETTRKPPLRVLRTGWAFLCGRGFFVAAAIAALVLPAD
jgi:hypothetical protein